MSKNQTEEQEAGLDSHDEFIEAEGGEETGKSKSETSSQKRKLHAALCACMPSNVCAWPPIFFGSTMFNFSHPKIL